MKDRKIHILTNIATLVVVIILGAMSFFYKSSVFILIHYLTGVLTTIAFFLPKNNVLRTAFLTSFCYRLVLYVMIYNDEGAMGAGIFIIASLLSLLIGALVYAFFVIIKGRTSQKKVKEKNEFNGENHSVKTFCKRMLRNTLDKKFFYKNLFSIIFIVLILAAICAKDKVSASRMLFCFSLEIIIAFSFANIKDGIFPIAIGAFTLATIIFAVASGALFSFMIFSLPYILMFIIIIFLACLGEHKRYFATIEKN